MERSAARDVTEVGIDVHRWLLPVIALGTVLAPLNSTMIAVAFPAIRQAFGAPVTEAAWLLTPYLVAMTVMQSIGGWLGEVRLPAR
jgi:MFS family permease